MEEPSMQSKHFSHEHPLDYVESCFDTNRVCSACKLTIMPKSFFHHCKVCNFSLHKVCYTMPKMVMHPADPNHSLNLVDSCVPNKSNDCEACGRYIAGFCYTCTKCSLYYHMLCVAMPLSVKIPSHSHILKLELKPLYDSKCDICDKPSYLGWHYHCSLCEFDAHLSCAVRFSPSLKDDRLNGCKSHQRELMELLSEGMKNVLDQSTPVSEAFTLPSCQFSDACFSLDISKSITVERSINHQIQTDNERILHDTNHGNEKLQLLKRQSFSFGVRDLKGLNMAPSTGICTPVWDELGCDNENGNTNATNDRMPFGDQAKGKENVNLRRPLWSKLLMCF